MDRPGWTERHPLHVLSILPGGEPVQRQIPSVRAEKTERANVGQVALKPTSFRTVSVTTHQRVTAGPP
jgi:hypothetical protein